MVPDKSYATSIVENLIYLGITDCFLVTGGAIAPVTDALVRSGKIKMHYMLTEQSAGIAAEAYGQFDGRPALLVVTSGPGVTNAVTPIAAAWTNSSPVVVISGQARSADVIAAKSSKNRQIGNQHLNTEKIVGSFVKWFSEPTGDFSVHEVCRKLMMEALTGRPGPVWLSIPQDIQRKLVSGTELVGAEGVSVQHGSSEEKGFAEKLWVEIAAASRPLIFVGNGARVRDGQAKLGKITESSGAALVTTWSGIDLIQHDHPNFCGRPGTITSSWAANLVQQNADFVLVLGARLDLAQVGFQPENFAPKAKIYRVDIDESEFLRLPVHDRLFNFFFDARNIVDELHQISTGEVLERRESWWKEISEFSKLPKAGDYRSADGVISTYDVVDSLSNLSAASVVLGSSGTCVEMVLQSWRISPRQRFLNSGGLGSMGFALSGGFGVSKKVHSDRVLIIESDGSFAMNIQDLQTIAASTGPSLKIVVLNSGGYKSISISQGKQGQVIHGASPSTGLALPEIELWTKAAGIECQSVSNPANLEKAIQDMWDSDGHYVLEIRVSALEEAFPRLTSRPNEFGQMVTADFSDLTPEIG